MASLAFVRVETVTRAPRRNLRSATAAALRWLPTRRGRPPPIFRSHDSGSTLGALAFASAADCGETAAYNTDRTRDA